MIAMVTKTQTTQQFWCVRCLLFCHFETTASATNQKINGHVDSQGRRIPVQDRDTRRRGHRAGSANATVSADVVDY